jgi:putative iron-regulated protein
MELLKLAACITAASLLAACGSDSDSYTASAPQQKLINTNADIAYATYTDSVITAKDLKTKLAAFKATPSAANLQAAKQAWLVSREPYGQTEVYRFRESPIEAVEGDLNAWPLGEALIDYVAVNDSDFKSAQVGVTANQAGINDNGIVDGTITTENIIGTTSVTINDALLATTATATDEHDVIAGYHAIEFLLWGQDLNTTTQAATNGTDRNLAVNTTSQGGQRPLNDFISTTENDSAARRHAFLEVAVDKLISDLEQVQVAWKDGIADNYRAQFTTITSDADFNQKLTEILTGMGTLSEGELAGERMQIALTGNSQEDEHSCFSDNTHRDVWLNAEGVSNSYYGDYAGYDSSLDGTDDVTTNAVTGYGVDDYLAEQGLDSLAATAKTKFDATKVNYTAIDTLARAGSPFDVQIMEANRTTSPIAITIESLESQSRTIQEIATELKLGDVVDDDASECDTSDSSAPC